MKKSLCRSCLFTASLLVLPGCLVINAALSVAGLLGSGPIEYAGTAYSVGEYAYHYAVNDKTPDEVIEDKLVQLMPGETESADGEAPVLVADAGETIADEASLPRLGEGPPNPATAAMLPAKPHPVAEIRPVTLLPDVAAEQPSASPPPTRQTASAAQTVREPVRTASAKKNPARSAEFSPRQTEPATETPAPAPDPLLTRLHRLELAFAQAERVSLNRPASGVRSVVSTNDAGQAGSGVSGTWSIRHPVMETAPGRRRLAPTAQTAARSRYM